MQEDQEVTKELWEIQNLWQKWKLRILTESLKLGKLPIKQTKKETIMGNRRKKGQKIKGSDLNSKISIKRITCKKELKKKNEENKFIQEITLGMKGFIS